MSILAGVDLHSGHIFSNVEARHRSLEFIALLKRLDAYYAAGALRICSHAQARLLAQPDRMRILEDGPNLPAPYSGGFR